MLCTAGQQELKIFLLYLSCMVSVAVYFQIWSLISWSVLDLVKLESNVFTKSLLIVT